MHCVTPNSVFSSARRIISDRLPRAIAKRSNAPRKKHAGAFILRSLARCGVSSAIGTRQMHRKSIPRDIRRGRARVVPDLARLVHRHFSGVVLRAGGTPFHARFVLMRVDFWNFFEPPAWPQCQLFEILGAVNRCVLVRRRRGPLKGTRRALENFAGSSTDGARPGGF